MKKKLYATALTVGAAATLIAGSGLLSTHAFANGAVDVDKTMSQSPTGSAKEVIRSTRTGGEGEVAPAIKASGFSAAPKKTSADMNEDKAVDIAKEALEEKFDVSLDGMEAFPIFCAREDMEGTYYYVSFTDAEAVQAQQAVGAKSGEIASGETSETVDIYVSGKNDNADIYIAFVNSKTGKVVSAEKNPTASTDTVAPTAPADPAN
jgi:hypothetical protein